MCEKMKLERKVNLEEVIKLVEPPCKGSMGKARKRWDSIAHPLHSLGKLEEFIINIAGMQRNHVIDIEKKALVVMCADNGVVEEGVTQSPQEVTAIVAENFMTGNCSAAIMCNKLGVDIYPIDIGVHKEIDIPSKKIMYGTNNMTKERAISVEETIKAIEVGIDTAIELKEKGYGALATGEMGIGNTTTSSAVATVLLDRTVEEMTGRGAGLSNEGWDLKVQAIKKAIELHNPDKADIVEVISCVGGLDIAGLVGVFIGGAYCKIPVLIDGFISGVAALCAERLCKNAKLYMIPSHMSKEPASKLVLEALGFDYALNLDMSLGEGTGAISLLPLIDLGNEIYMKMTSFEEQNIEQYKEFTC